jgi:arabinogalactan oligomer/maltooligosaccharide transport system permease protein
MLINNKATKLPKMWRTLFIIAIAVPQFVTLLLVRNFFADTGIVNTICSNLGITQFLKNIGLVSSGLSYIPFLTDAHWAKVMIILINIWVGVPYQMLIATGVLMNIPSDQIESARIDGANKFQVFCKITMPYVLFIQGPALITDFVKNINNFNVIYLLTQDVYITSDQALANSNAKEVDLLVTWLFRLTNEYYNYKMASVIGIIVFVICAAFTLISFSKMISGNREEDFQ